MHLNYSNPLEKALFIITDFSNSSETRLLKNEQFYKIFWSRHATIILEIDGYNVALDKSQLIFCTPVNIVDIGLNQDGIIAFLFNREFYCIRDHDYEVSCDGLLFYGSQQPRVISLSEKENTSYNMVYQMFIKEFETKDYIQGEMLRVLLKKLLINSTRLIKEQINQPSLTNEKIDIIRRFNVLVEVHFKEKHQVSDYADMLCKSPKTLSNLFKMYCDNTPLSYINNRIIVEAKRLLMFSDKTSEQIAYLLGYDEPGHFSKFFKKQVGLSPGQFRKKELLLV